MIGTVFEVLTAQRTRWRRARNLRAGAQTQAVRTWPALRLSLHLSVPGPLARLGLAGILMAAAGAWVIATHARWMAAAGGEGAVADAGLASLQPALPGAAFTVPPDRGVRLEDRGGTALLTLSGMAAEPSRHIDLCSQMADPVRGNLLPLRIGYRFDEIAALAVRGGTPLRNVVLSDRAMPHIEIAGQAAANAPLALRWSGRQAHWIGDGGPAVSGASGQGALLRQGWLLWGADGALRVLRRPSTACPQAGELVLQPWRLADAGATGRALVMAFPATGAPLETWLAPGDYRVPAAAPARLEDEELFEQLRARGLLRLGPGGLAELAPPDLAAWRSSGATAWDRAVLDEEGRRLLRHLYGRADGGFVREQVRIFNSERRLLAWRVRAADLVDAGAGSWRAETGGVPAPLAHDLPAAGSRLFARLPQGWAPWQRIKAWPAGAIDRNQARLRLLLSRPARAGDWIQLMLAGRMMGVQGARLAAAPAPACGGRACQSPDQVQVLDLQLEPGVHEVVLDAAPLGMDALAAPGDARYRHVVERGGQLVWQAMPATPATPAGQAARPAPPGVVQVRLVDRNGAALWHDGAPSLEARAAGLASLLGVRAEQASGVAGMLARLPGAGPHAARLTLDLGLQRAAQAALDCIGLRQGQWDGRTCSGAGATPDGRQAGLVVLDTETGDILAAAGAGGADIEDADWRELRDFDRIDPAASPLRLPAWQHDGGAQRSPGSTFKIVSSLGLELAARGDPRLDALLDGLPLAGINSLARERGFDFRTDAPGYPVGGRARITNFRDQGLDRRAQDGRLGLAQALTYSLNTWFAWTGELSDRSLFGMPAGGVPDLQPLQPGALDEVRPIVAMARKLGFGAPLRLDGGLLPSDYPWSAWDALQATPAGIDPVHTRHELRQMAIGLRMQATPLQMALVAGAVGQGRTIRPRLLAELDGRAGASTAGTPLGVRLDRVRAGMKGVVDAGTAAGAFRGAGLEGVRRGLSGKTGTAPVGDGSRATVWFTGWLEPGSIPGQAHRLALAVFVSQSEGTGGGHAAPVAAAVLRHLAEQGEK
jgi:cell division protein FtsI/penicillin-binding protein 2